MWGFDPFKSPEDFLGRGAGASNNIQSRELHEYTPPYVIEPGNNLVRRSDDLMELTDSPTIITFSLSFTNRMGVQVSLSDGTHCPAEKMPIEFYHEHSLHFSIYTLHLGKRWYFWRLKDILKCWFCEECKISKKALQRFSDKQLASSTNFLSMNY
jgi:hypothetical protein